MLIKIWGENEDTRIVCSSKIYEIVPLYDLKMIRITLKDGNDEIIVKFTSTTNLHENFNDLCTDLLENDGSMALLYGE